MANLRLRLLLLLLRFHACLACHASYGGDTIRLRARSQATGRDTVDLRRLTRRVDRGDAGCGMLSSCETGRLRSHGILYLGIRLRLGLRVILRLHQLGRWLLARSRLDLADERLPLLSVFCFLLCFFVWL